MKECAVQGVATTPLHNRVRAIFPILRKEGKEGKEGKKKEGKRRKEGKKKETGELLSIVVDEKKFFLSDRMLKPLFNLR